MLVPLTLFEPMYCVLWQNALFPLSSLDPGKHVELFGKSESSVDRMCESQVILWQRENNSLYKDIEIHTYVINK